MDDTARPSYNDSGWQIALLAIVLAVLVWSWIGATSRLTWWLEAFPVFLAAPVLAASYRRFPLTRLTYLLIALHMCILLVGAHYTYEHVPLFGWIRGRFHLQRNDYDKVGHLAQGFIPAIITREIFIRRQVVVKPWWRVFLILCVCMALSACYELLEWSVALLEGSSAEAFLATQGDPFDTQNDMFCALIGSISAQVMLSRLHDHEIARLQAQTSPD